MSFPLSLCLFLKFSNIKDSFCILISNFGNLKGLQSHVAKEKVLSNVTFYVSRSSNYIESKMLRFYSTSTITPP